MKLKSVWIFACVLMFSSIAFAQENVIVPNIIGLNVPQAVAVLNKAGLRLGMENNLGWTSDSGLPENSIQDQSVAPEQAVPFGTSVDVTVLRSANAFVIFDDNDLTLGNLSGSDLDLTTLTFVAKDGNLAQFSASRWSSTLRNSQCTQIWSVGRNGPKGLDECTVIQNWLVTTNANEHFWTGAGGTTQFDVVQNGVERATCAVTNPGRCDFYVAAGGSGGDATPYVYFAYDANTLSIINQSPNQWMVLNGYEVHNYTNNLQGVALNVGDASFYTRFPPDVEDVARLAPSQCVLFTKSSLIDSVQPPQPCEVIATLPISDEVIFWGASFGVQGVDGVERTCPAGVPDRLTVCVMPR